MLKKIWQWLWPATTTKTHYKVVEIDTASRLPMKSDKEIMESVSTLQAHPGFLHLVQRLAFQSAALKSKLAFEKHSSIDEVTFLQAGIYWSGWLKQEIARSVQRPVERQVDPFELEMEEFQKLDAQVERVGQEWNTSTHAGFTFQARDQIP